MLKTVDSVLFIYDITNRRSFHDINEIWLQYVHDCTRTSPVYTLIGTKSDLGNRQVSYCEATAFAIANNMLFFEVSAKTKENVTTALLEATVQVLNKRNMHIIDSSASAVSNSEANCLLAPCYLQ